MVVDLRLVLRLALWAVLVASLLGTILSALGLAVLLDRGDKRAVWVVGVAALLVVYSLAAILSSWALD